MIDQVQEWFNYPMGPQIRGYLGIEDKDYTGDTRSDLPTAEEATRFVDFLINNFTQQPISPFNRWANIVEELNAMGLSQAVLFLIEEDYREEIENDFRALLASGSSLMLEEKWETAVSYFKRAQQVKAEEIAPYANLASIYYSLEKDEDALFWANAGLEVDENHQRLWEITASIFLEQSKSTAGERVKELAIQKQSYMGISLACQLIDPDDHLLKAQTFEEIYHQDVSDQEFLIEYTAALGLASQFAKIPNIVWQARQNLGNQLHWKLIAHAAQAHLAQEQLQQAESFIELLENPLSETPPNVVQELKQALTT